MFQTPKRLSPGRRNIVAEKQLLPILFGTSVVPRIVVEGGDRCNGQGCQLYNKYEDLSDGDKLQIMLLIDLVEREIDWRQAHSGLMSSME
jgi:hypothetical protein